MHRTLMVIVGIVAFLGAMVSCNPNGTSPRPITVIGDAGPGTMQVDFTYLPETGVEPWPNRIVIVNAGATDSAPTISPFSFGIARMHLPKDGVYVIGLVYESAGASNTNIRSIGGTIGTIGNISVVTNGLDSLPIGEDAGDLVDLGELGEGDDEFGSGIGSAELADSLGYDEATLNGYAGFDDTLVKYLNPDIDQNGILDSDQGLDWQFRVDYFFGASVSSIEFEANRLLFTPADLPVSINYEVKYWDGLPNPPLREDVRMDFTVEDTGQVITLQAGAAGFFDYLDAEYYFWLSPVDSLEPPFNGDAVLHLADIDHRFQSLRFFSPADDFDGFMILIYETAVGTGGNLDSVSWKWCIYQNGEYRLASQEEVELRARSFVVYFYCAEAAGDVVHALSWPPGSPTWLYHKKVAPWGDEIDLREITGPPFSSHGTLPLGAYAIDSTEVYHTRIDYHDLADNVVAFEYGIE